jgi:hypothetical protein
MGRVGSIETSFDGYPCRNKGLEPLIRLVNGTSSSEKLVYFGLDGLLDLCLFWIVGPP